MHYTVVKELRSTAKYNKYIELKDLMFILSYFAVFYFFHESVYIKLQTIYFIFSFACAVFFVMKVPGNPERKNYQRMIIMLQRDFKVYKPISTKRKRVRGNENR
ncbi:DUF5592 family protein [Roseburia hominis]